MYSLTINVWIWNFKKHYVLSKCIHEGYWSTKYERGRDFRHSWHIIFLRQFWESRMTFFMNLIYIKQYKNWQFVLCTILLLRTFKMLMSGKDIMWSQANNSIHCFSFFSMTNKIWFNWLVFYNHSFLRVCCYPRWMIICTYLNKW